MDFKKATDELFAPLSHDGLANALGISVASIRQARLKPEAGAHRTPPKNWEKAIIRLAGERMEHYRRLIEQLGNNNQSDAEAGGKLSPRRGLAE